MKKTTSTSFFNAITNGYRAGCMCFCISLYILIKVISNTTYLNTCIHTFVHFYMCTGCIIGRGLSSPKTQLLTLFGYTVRIMWPFTVAITFKFLLTCKLHTSWTDKLQLVGHRVFLFWIRYNSIGLWTLTPT